MDFWTEIMPAVEAAEGKLASVGDDASLLPESVRVFLVVNGAQGVIDNGGYAFFFGQDWPNTPPYEDFISAYEAIGCSQQAADLRRVVATFPFSDPQLHREKRRAYIDQHYDADAYAVRGWGNALCGDKEVWEKLAKYHERHEDDFV
jgi:hypothetical protein